MNASIRLSRFATHDSALPMAQRQAWHVSVRADGTEMDDHIFVYHVGTPSDAVLGDRFECVASVNQMHELPRNQGVSTTLTLGVPYYRSNILEFVARSAEEAESLWQKIVEDTQLLVLNWNAAYQLQRVSVVQISEDRVEDLDMSLIPPIRLQMVTHPAGTPGVDADDQPIITVPDAAVTGWLPVSALGGAPMPHGARFYYNLYQDALLTSQWPPKEPMSGNQLFRNGILMPYGLVWQIAYNQIWWMTFRPETVPGYQRSTGQAADWGAPWASDYVDRLNPGAVQNRLELLLYK